MKPLYQPSRFDTDIDHFLQKVPWLTATDARRECFMAPTEMEYTYGSGRGVRTYKSIPFEATVAAIMEDLNTSVTDGPNLRFNVCFLNRYDDQGQHLGWHADDSPGMNHEHPIAVVSFGEEREIWWRTNGQTGVVPADQRQKLGSGSLFLMPAGFQRTHQHRIPKGDRSMKPRVSLTFREYVP